MKTFFTTTAIALCMAIPATAQTTTTGQTETTTMEPGTSEQATSGFYGSMARGDLRASELMNAEIYARATGAPGADTTTGQTGMTDGGIAEDTEMEQDGAGRWGSSIGVRGLEGMENIGTVNDLLLDQQGRVRAVLVDIGAFLGMGARQVALDLDQVSFSTDEQDSSQIYVISTVSAEALEAAPEFDDTLNRGMTTAPAGQEDAMNRQPGDGGTWLQGRDRMMAPTIEREGYRQTEATEMSSENLVGANVYDANDENVGSVDEIVLGQGGEAEFVVMDVGGFLGLGTHTIAVGFDEITVMQNEGMNDLRVYVDVTEDSLEAMPEYTAQ